MVPASRLLFLLLACRFIYSDKALISSKLYAIYYSQSQVATSLTSRYYRALYNVTHQIHFIPPVIYFLIRPRAHALLSALTASRIALYISQSPSTVFQPYL